MTNKIARRRIGPAGLRPPWTDDVGEHPLVLEAVQRAEVDLEHVRQRNRRRIERAYQAAASTLHCERLERYGAPF